ncbi:hypothetical protein SynBIOSE41_01694 [Synechococcus sp. BIOS-E4-1]|nr:hypothetical protein SynBIOSE41_01694 [Synechococcus sp. BIOS-E4-1]
MCLTKFKGQHMTWLPRTAQTRVCRGTGLGLSNTENGWKGCALL